MKDISVGKVGNVWGWRGFGNERHLPRQNERRLGIVGMKDISLGRARNVWGWRESGNERHLS